MFFNCNSCGAGTSTLIPSHETKRHECFTTLETRRSLHVDRCQDACNICVHDWASAFDDKSVYYIPAIENETSGNWAALVMPDALPFRLGLVTYAATMLTLHEDIQQIKTNVGYQEDDLNAFFVGGLEAALPLLRRHNVKLPSSQPGKNHDTNKSYAIRRLLAPWTQALLNTDRQLGLEVLQTWSKHFRTLPSLPSCAEDIGTLDAYLRVRVACFGRDGWLALLRFALDLRVSGEGLRAAEKAVATAMRAVALTADYWCWDKVSRDCQAGRRSMNAVAFIMAERGCTALEAKARVKSLATEAEKEFLRLKGKILVAGDEGLQLYLDAIEHFVAGNSLWSSTCPRYHGYRSFDVSDGASESSSDDGFASTASTSDD